MDLRLKPTPCLWLVGFMGSGKSTVGPLLAHELGWPYVDLDEEIEKRAGRGIAEVFSDQGEAVFRDLEHEALLGQVAHVRCGGARVVSLGGGAFVPERNRQLMADCGISLWLDLPCEQLWARLPKDGTRPLARDREAFAKLYEDRRASYALAEYRLDAERQPDEIVAAVKGLGLW